MYRKHLFFFISWTCTTQIFHEIINCKVSHFQVLKSETQIVIFLLRANTRIASERRLKDEDIAQELILDSGSDAHTNEDEISPPQSHSDNKGDDRTETGCTQWTDSTQSQPSVPVIHRFTGDPSGLRQKKAHDINKDSSPLSIFMLLFLEIMQLLVEETNRYYHQYLDTPDEGHSPLPDVTTQEIHLFLTIFVWVTAKEMGSKVTGPH
jgi:hypothetical protein